MYMQKAKLFQNLFLKVKIKNSIRRLLNILPIRTKKSNIFIKKKYYSKI